MRILVVDDNRSSADLLVRALNRQGEEAEALYDGASAVRRLELDPPDLVLTDLRMEGVDGMDVLRAARACRPPVETIVFTAYGGIETAVEAMQLGARDFLTKPVTLDQVLGRVEAARNSSSPPDPALAPPLTDQSPAARELVATLRRVANAPSHVWLEGEIGSGRGHTAWTLHQETDKDAPFAALDPTRAFEWPRSGTVVLSNVDDLPDDLQRDLVRRLQRVPEGLRIIATASPDARSRLVQESHEQRGRSADGLIRQDLYFKLAVIVIRVPPLRQRTDDIVPMFQDALQRFAARYRRPVPPLQAEDLHRLIAHSWPGNVRELLNVAERAVVLGAPDGIDLLVSSAATPAAGLPQLTEGFELMPYLEQVERRILVEAHRITHGDRHEMGRILGVERNTLRYKLNKYDLV